MKTIEQLKAERDALSAQIEQAIQSQRAEAIANAKKIIADFALTARDLGLSNAAAGAKKTGDARAAVAPKYRDPADANNTWTGRGKPPRWLAAAIAAGKSKDAFLI